MIARRCTWLACAVMLFSTTAQSYPASAQGVPRVKARLVSLDGDTLTLERLMSAPAATPVPLRQSKSGGGFTPAPSTKGAKPVYVPAPDAPQSEGAATVDTPLLVKLLPDTRYVGTEPV